MSSFPPRSPPQPDREYVANTNGPRGGGIPPRRSHSPPLSSTSSSVGGDNRYSGGISQNPRDPRHYLGDQERDRLASSNEDPSFLNNSSGSIPPPGVLHDSSMIGRKDRPRTPDRFRRSPGADLDSTL